MQLSETRIQTIERIIKEKFENYPDRLNHIMGVVKMAVYLADIYNVDSKKAKIAALIHDFFKYDTILFLKEYLKNDPSIVECEECNVLYHAYAAANALKDVFLINDEEIKNAIKYHVFGRENMTRLEEIILISDYSEETRPYSSCQIVRNVLLDGKLEEAIYLSTKYTIEHLKSQNIKPHPTQEKILKVYKERIENETN